MSQQKQITEVAYSPEEENLVYSISCCQALEENPDYLMENTDDEDSYSYYGTCYN